MELDRDGGVAGEGAGDGGTEILLSGGSVINFNIVAPATKASTAVVDIQTVNCEGDCFPIS